MPPNQYLYLAGMGMVTAIGGRVDTISAAVTCAISAYQASEHFYQQGQAITLASVPNQLLEALELELDEGNSYNWRHDRITKMAIIAARQACQNLEQSSIPLIMGLAEVPEDPSLPPFLNNLVNNCQPWLGAHLSRSIATGRASGMDAVAFAFNHVPATYPYCLVGGSDSYQDMAILTPLMEQGRLHSSINNNGFAPGEGACFLLLTPHRELATLRNGHIIGLRPPGISEELGHLNSHHPYRGDGLAEAFKRALHHQAPQSISRIYSSLNGENYWAKELGVAHLRSQTAFQPDLYIAHPADCYGDLGCATATSLIALAAEHLIKTPTAHAHLVCCSSDTKRRGALVVEKLPA